MSYWPAFLQEGRGIFSAAPGTLLGSAAGIGIRGCSLPGLRWLEIVEWLVAKEPVRRSERRRERPSVHAAMEPKQSDDR
jgi:hypothetical protein